MDGFQIAKDYENRNIIGWKETIQPGIAAKAFNLLRGSFTHNAPLFSMYEKYKGNAVYLWQVTRKVLGHDTLNYPQQIGDCVSFGAKNGCEYLSCCDILIRGDREKFRPVFPPYYYGTGRIYVGGEDGDYSDGSLGSWMAEAVMKYGTLFSDESGVPAYSGSVAKEFGAKRSTLDKWKPTAVKYLIKSATQIKSWDNLVVALSNGYPCPTASDVGYNMEVSSDGFHRQTTDWSHQMCFIGAVDDPTEPYAYILNNWGDCHGHLKDFKTGEDVPIGCLRVRRADAEKHIRAGETYAYSQFDGFPEVPLNKLLFKLI